MLDAFDVGGDTVLSDFGGKRIALIFESGKDLYSSITLLNSSSDFTEIKVSKSPPGN